MTTIGALNKYIYDYTDCINACDFYNTDKTKRLGYDNTLCLLKCNSYFTQLRKLNLPSQNIYFPDTSTSPSLIHKPDNKCGNSLTCMENHYQKDLCIRQCTLNESFFSPYRMKRCIDLCHYGK